MSFYQEWAVVQQLDEDEFGTTDLVYNKQLNQWAIAEPGGYYDITLAQALDIMKGQ